MKRREGEIYAKRAPRDRTFVYFLASRVHTVVKSFAFVECTTLLRGAATRPTTARTAPWKGKLGFARESPGNNLRARYDSRHDQPSDLRENRNWLGRFYSGPPPPPQAVRYNNSRITQPPLFYFIQR